MKARQRSGSWLSGKTCQNGQLLRYHRLNCLCLGGYLVTEPSETPLFQTLLVEVPSRTANIPIRNGRQNKKYVFTKVNCMSKRMLITVFAGAWTSTEDRVPKEPQVNYQCQLSFNTIWQTISSSELTFVVVLNVARTMHYTRLAKNLITCAQL